MKLHHCRILPLVLALSCCGPQRKAEQPANNSEAPVLPAPSAPPAVAKSAIAAPSAPAPAEPARATDPKSVDAALAIARTFADLISRQKFAEAYMLLGPNGGFSSAADLAKHFSPYSALKLSVDDSPPPSPEGAAGSIYLSVRANISGTVDGRHVDRPATITMRRVNDVPGSTEAQRRWHIEGFSDSAT